MAKNGISGDNRRHGAVKQRSQTFNPVTEQWVKKRYCHRQIYGC